LIVKNAFGSAYVLMNSKSVGADIVFAYDDAEMGIMDSDKAAMIICPDGSVEEREAVREEFEAKSQGINNALRRGYIDRVIEHIDTRKYLISAFEMLFSKRESDIVKKHSSK
jgi:acetyl-CoA carboxylase carboxyltransferase component